MTGKNQGEGNREAAKQYNEATKRHVSEHDTKEEAKKAKSALESDREALKRAEEKGKNRAAEEDPQVKRR